MSYNMIMNCIITAIQVAAGIACVIMLVLSIKHESKRKFDINQNRAIDCRKKIVDAILRIEV